MACRSLLPYHLASQAGPLFDHPVLCRTGQEVERRKSEVAAEAGHVLCAHGASGSPGQHTYTHTSTRSPVLGSGQTAELHRIISFVVPEGIRTKPATGKAIPKGAQKATPLCRTQTGQRYHKLEEDLDPSLSSYTESLIYCHPTVLNLEALGQKTAA